MKKLLVLLFSIFLLSSPSVFADDISDFQIEGMSIGDSLLDYMTEDEIVKEIERTKDWSLHLQEPNKYAKVYLGGKFENYDYLGFYIKNNQPNQYVTNKNEEYIIQSIFGHRDYIDNFDACLNKRDEIANLLSRSFPNTQKTEDFLIHGGDPSGKSIIDAVYFNFDSGADVEASCYNFDEDFRRQVNWAEGLMIAIQTKEILEWSGNHK
jgi:hypothetical protein